MPKSKLFSPFALRSVEIPNRIVVSSMCQYASADGEAGDWHLVNLGQYVLGAAGLVMTEATHVSAVGRITPRCLGLYSDSNERTLKRVVDFCREFGVAKIGVQLAHAGRKGSTNPPLKGGKPLAKEEGAWETVGPSAVPFGEGWHTPRALDAAGLAQVKAEFVAATERSARVGFDLVELHCAHGYLMHQFLSPVANKRTDGYGGSLEGRMRFPLETFEAVRAVWPKDKPLGVRISATDWVEEGFTPEEAVVLIRTLKEMGCDFADVSSGGVDPKQKIPLRPGYQVHLAEKVKRETGIPTWAVGLITDPFQAEAVVAEGRADFVALARGMMYDPRWAWHAAEALGAETAYAPQMARCAPGAWPRELWYRAPAEQAAD